MYHNIKLLPQEKIKAWLSLCDFSFRLIADNFGKKEFMRRLRKMRGDRLNADYLILKGLRRLK